MLVMSSPPRIAFIVTGTTSGAVLRIWHNPALDLLTSNPGLLGVQGVLKSRANVGTKRNARSIENASDPAGP